MCQRLVLYQTILSDTPEIRSLRLLLADPLSQAVVELHATGRQILARCVY
jgi:hypothetical protein